MYQKFIINQDGVLKFGHVYLHKDLLQKGERCIYGGGLWKIDSQRNAIMLYGRSFDFARQISTMFIVLTGAVSAVENGLCSFCRYGLTNQA
ncbi:MAG: hypothetical protein UHT92_03905 [Prevotella sp.]|nr:hypothetical protein [Prevotella sp.]